jgi:hypothetical protein
MTRSLLNFILYIFHSTVLYLQMISTNLLHDTFLLLVKSQTCFSMTDWPSSGSLLWNMQRMFQLLEFSHMVQTILCLQFLKLMLWYNTVEMQLKYSKVQYKIKYSIKLYVVSKYLCFQSLLVWSRFSESVNMDNKLLIRTLRVNKKDMVK